MRQGKLRSQSRKQVTRRIYLCDDCFGRLAARQLTDLFIRFSDERASALLGHWTRATARPSATVGRPATGRSRAAVA